MENNNLVQAACKSFKETFFNTKLVVFDMESLCVYHIMSTEVLQFSYYGNIVLHINCISRIPEWSSIIGFRGQLWQINSVRSLTNGVNGMYEIILSNRIY